MEKLDNKEMLMVLSKVEPNLLNTISLRLEILKLIEFLQPVGRRVLSAKLNMTERVIRSEINVLKGQGLIEITPEGMNITSSGKDTIEKLNMIFHDDIKELSALENKLSKALGIKKAIIVSGSVDKEPIAYKEMGRAASIYLNSIVEDGNIIGLTGGSSVAHMVWEYQPEGRDLSNATVIPARGGLGKKVEYQANTLVEKLSNKMGCNYKNLYMIDSLQKNTIESLKREPVIKELISLIDKIDILIFGIGRADVMARRRDLSKEIIEKIENNRGVSEAFGYYFNEDGEIIYEISTIGIKLEKFKSLEKLIAIAAGIEKVKAIKSICKLNPNIVLVTDEYTAKKLI